VLLEYLDDPSLTRPVLLMHGDEPRAVALLRNALHAVAQGESIEVTELPGFSGVDGCSLTLRLDTSDLGVQPIKDGGRYAFECGLHKEAWATVGGLLEPFSAHRDDRAHSHQYLTAAGKIEWIISTDRSW
jgi:hypothetical protein